MILYILFTIKCLFYSRQLYRLLIKLKTRKEIFHDLFFLHPYFKLIHTLCCQICKLAKILEKNLTLKKLILTKHLNLLIDVAYFNDNLCTVYDNILAT